MAVDPPAPRQFPDLTGFLKTCQVSPSPQDFHVLSSRFNRALHAFHVLPAPPTRLSGFPISAAGFNRPASGVILLLALFLLLTLTSCVTLKDPEASQEQRADTVAVVQAGQQVGQRFVSRRPGLNSAQLWLNLPPAANPDAVLTAELYHDPAGPQPLQTISVTFTTIGQSSPVTLSFPPQHDPPGQSYYLLLKSEVGAVNVLGRSEDAYAHGELYVNGIRL